MVELTLYIACSINPMKTTQLTAVGGRDDEADIITGLT